MWKYLQGLKRSWYLKLYYIFWEIYREIDRSFWTSMKRLFCWAQGTFNEGLQKLSRTQHVQLPCFTKTAARCVSETKGYGNTTYFTLWHSKLSSALVSKQRFRPAHKHLLFGLLFWGFLRYGWHSANFLWKVLHSGLECSHTCPLTCS